MRTAAARRLLLGALVAAAPAMGWAAQPAAADAPRKAARRTKPAWAAKVKSRTDVVYWTEPFEGKTRYLGVGMAQGIRDRALRAVAAEDRARAALLHALGLARTSLKTDGDGTTTLTTEAKGLLEGARITDRYTDRRGTLYALAEIVR
jgi:hypothetical protein